MDNQIVQIKIEIDSNSESIWKVLTNEEEFSNCFNGLEIECNDWKIGSKIIFKVEGTESHDYAIITEIEDNRKLKYHYFKTSKNTYNDMSFAISDLNNKTSELKLIGQNFIDLQEYEHSKQAWKGMLSALKAYLEN